MTLDTIAQWIILIGAVVTALKIIYSVFAKPTSFFKKKTTESQKRAMKETLEEELPVLIAEMGKPYVRYITQHGEALKAIEECNQTTRAALQNMIRQRILEIYYTRKTTKQLYYFEKECLDQLYADYKTFNANSYVEELYRRMNTWSVLPEENISPEYE